MAAIDDVLERIDGLRRDAADRVKGQFNTVDALATASKEELTKIKGVGPVMADRLRTAAITARAKPQRQAEPTPTSPAGEEPAPAETAARAADSGKDRVIDAARTVGGAAKTVGESAVRVAAVAVREVRKRLPTGNR